jgi:hypothetical protein
MKIGDILVLCENHHIYKKGEFGRSWTEIQLYKGDRFEVISKAEHPFKDWKLKLIDSQKIRVNTIFDETSSNNYKYKIDISFLDKG